MPLETAKIEHVFNVIRRQFAEEFKDVTLLYVVYEPGKANQALSAKRQEITRHPQADPLFALLRKIAVPAFDHSEFTALQTVEEKSAIPFLKRQNTLAVFFINTAHINTQEEARHLGYQKLWHMLDVMEAQKNNKTEDFVETNNILRPVTNKINIAHRNMLGDVFAAVLTEMMGQKDAITDLLRKRCLQSMQAVIGYNADLFPYPIAAESTQVIYDEFTHDTPPKSRLISLAIDMTNEINYTFDETSIKQWQAFASSAQRMAWLGYDKHKILSAATYSSEDPYVRSMAYMVAETLSIEPSLYTDFKTYNPFADEEGNKRQHQKFVDRSLENLLARPAEQRTHALISQITEQQCLRLLEGRVMGWCASALWTIAEDLKEDAPESDIREKFKAAQSIITWHKLLQLGDAIIRTKRKGTLLTMEKLTHLCEEIGELSPLIQSLKHISPEKIKQSAQPVEKENKEEIEIEEEIDEDKRPLPSQPHTEPSQESSSILENMDTGISFEEEEEEEEKQKTIPRPITDE